MKHLSLKAILNLHCETCLFYKPLTDNLCILFLKMNYHIVKENLFISHSDVTC